ncbi:MAG: hypothetical protein GF384_01525, partial [Elusimicrobia bacterium]|nr:hypothetical protein [Elusimicrobiota bacterium]
MFCVDCLNAESRSQITQYGITWTFDKEYEVGQFVNGDWWLVGPVTITAIDPPSEEITKEWRDNTGNNEPPHVWTGPRTMNGSQINPLPKNKGRQGYDSEMYAWHSSPGGTGLGRIYGTNYDSDLNVADDIHAGNHLQLQPGSSLISTISYEFGNRPQLDSAAVLTVLNASPPDGSFRPPYAGNDKPLYSSLNLRNDLLPNLTHVEHMPDIQSITDKFQRMWLDHFSHAGDGTQYSSPESNMPTYGREYMRLVGQAILILMLDEQELINTYGVNNNTLLIRMVQLGIDLYGVVENDGYWVENGGINNGRKWPILFTGLMLDHQGMKEIGQRSPTMPYLGFMEDAQTFYVTQESVDITHSPQWNPDPRAEKIPYEIEDIGMPEWGIRHYSNPYADNKSLDATYRTINGMTYPGNVLGMLIMRQKQAYNHDALFDY